jgi:hypothetical protein
MKRPKRTRVKPGRPQTLWDPERPPVAVEKYYNTFQGETMPWCTETFYPYAGTASVLFRRARPEEYERFNQRMHLFGEDTWTLECYARRDDPTADLFAAAELLGAETSSRGSNSGPGGGYYQGVAHFHLLDGLVFAAVDIQEDQWDNSLTFDQHILISGPWVYRAVLELLGFDTPRTLLPTERRRPSAAEVRELVDRLLRGEEVDVDSL